MAAAGERQRCADAFYVDALDVDTHRGHVASADAGEIARPDRA